MYLTAHRVRQIKGNKPEVGINAFLLRHLESDLPRNMRFDNEKAIDQIANSNTGKLVADSTDLVPGGSSVLSFIDIVGKENIDRTRIQNLLDQMEPKIKGMHTPITEFAPDGDLSVRFGITLGLKGYEVIEYKALTERAMSLFESPEPPKWQRSEAPWIEIHYDISDYQEILSLSPETANKLKQMHDKLWISKRALLDRETKIVAESMYGDLIQYIAPVLTGLTLEQIAAEGGLILYDLSSHKKIKWPEFREL